MQASIYSGQVIWAERIIVFGAENSGDHDRRDCRCGYRSK